MGTCAIYSALHHQMGGVVLPTDRCCRQSCVFGLKILIFVLCQDKKATEQLELHLNHPPKYGIRRSWLRTLVGVVSMSSQVAFWLASNHIVIHIPACIFYKDCLRCSVGN